MEAIERRLDPVKGLINGARYTAHRDGIVSQLKGKARRCSPLREGRAPVRERLMAMLFLAALLHAIVILGLTFTAAGTAACSDSPQLDVLLVTNEVPEAQSNDQGGLPRPAHPDWQRQHRHAVAAGKPRQPRALRSPSRQQATATATRPGQPRPGQAGAEPAARPAPTSATSATAPAAAAQTAALPEVDRRQTPGEPRSGRGDAVELLLRGKANE
jgi:hypothetical protein